MVNDRLDLGGFDGYVPDMVTPEQFTPTERPTYLGGPVTWEGCQTLSGSWGYYRDEESWKSPDQLIRVLVDHVALDGNLLMNVGPTGRGTFDQRAIDALDVYARWMRVNDRAIQGCGASALAPPSGCRYTQNGNKLYLHVFDWPFRHIHIDGLGDRLRYAQLLHDASEIRWQTSDVKVANHTDVPTPSGAITLELPVKKPDVVVPVIELFLDAH
jgi:alpha-L-fucosidase